MQEARIELLQRMPLFGGVDTSTIQFLLALCPIVSVPADAYFFREREDGNSMFVLELGKSAVLKSWHGEDYLLQTLEEGDCFGEMALIDHGSRSASVRASKIVGRSEFQLPTFTEYTRGISSSFR